MGLDKNRKSVWGRALWTFMHTAAEFVDDPEGFSLFIHSLVRTLPCPECRKHLSDYILYHPPHQIIDSSSAVVYVNNLHNHVNVITGKPQFPVASTASAARRAGAQSQPVAPNHYQSALRLVQSRPSPPQLPRAPRTIKAATAPRLRRIAGYPSMVLR